MSNVSPIATSAVTSASTSASTAPARPGSDRCDRFGIYPECPLCGGSLHAEHAHFKCAGCGWRDSCCD